MVSGVLLRCALIYGSHVFCSKRPTMEDAVAGVSNVPHFMKIPSSNVGPESYYKRVNPLF